MKHYANFIVTTCRKACCCPGVESMAVNKPGLQGGKQAPCHISLTTFQSKPSLHAACWSWQKSAVRRCTDEGCWDMSQQ